MHYAIPFITLTTTLSILGNWCSPRHTVSHTSPVTSVTAIRIAHQEAKDSGNIPERFACPPGYFRDTATPGSFAHFLRHFPLKPGKNKVYFYDGNEKTYAYHAAVLELSTGKQDLQQCADAVMRLRAEYWYAKGAHDRMHFNFTNGFRCGFDKWAQGCRVKVNGNQTTWYCGQTASSDRKAFESWMLQVFMFAGTLSLEKELKPISAASLVIGDVWIKGGSPGHAVIVMDVCRDSSGNKLFMIAQSYMPAQDMHILRNTAEPAISPWFRVPDVGQELVTPEWTFAHNQLRRF